MMMDADKSVKKKISLCCYNSHSESTSPEITDSACLQPAYIAGKRMQQSFYSMKVKTSASSHQTGLKGERGGPQTSSAFCHLSTFAILCCSQISSYYLCHCFT
ncbi:hypothetical protein ATANTOWER_012565 [Ataeniobius toweri]|uniref:Uncharacterized protein n=1 Tax=Ataeniobius toweri TaxID=208326 RepID=A0ABU7B038_9TELE|nr:hypothetical protein [Ataeniobius toweri]